MIFDPVIIGSTVDTKTGFATKNPILAEDAFGLELDTMDYKVGDGETAWAELEVVGNLVTGEAEDDT